MYIYSKIIVLGLFVQLTHYNWPKRVPRMRNLRWLAMSRLAKASLTSDDFNEFGVDLEELHINDGGELSNKVICWAFAKNYNLSIKLNTFLYQKLFKCFFKQKQMNWINTTVNTNIVLYISYKTCVHWTLR